VVNITHKSSTLRKAIAIAELIVSNQDTIDAIQNRTVPKGDVFEFARAAGLLACKKTYEVIPDCHPLPVEYAAITYTIESLKVLITVEVHTVYKTGVEVEAMHAAAITALTMYDMLKPIDKQTMIGSIRLQEKTGGKSGMKYRLPEEVRIAVITCSDSASKGIIEDKSGKIICDELVQHGMQIERKEIIADDFDTIQSVAKECIAAGFDLVLFTGGTGLGPRDVTPEALKPLIDREVPGVMEASRSYGQQRTPYAMLSRGISGFAGGTLIVTMPGSSRGASESMKAIFPHLLHVFRVKAGDRHD